MKRRFDVRITFSGMVVAVVSGCLRTREGQRGPHEAEAVEILFANTLSDHDDCASAAAGSHSEAHSSSHDHFPTLTYYAEDDLNLVGGEKISPSPLGKEAVQLDISNKDVTVIAPYPYPRADQSDRPKVFHQLSWLEGGLTGGASQPTSTREDHFLDWTLQTDELGLEASSLKRDLASTKITLPPGAWTNAGVVRNREVASLSPVLWDIDSPGLRGAVTRALSRGLRLTLKGLRSSLVVQLKDRNSGDIRHVVLVPGADDLLHLAFTNQPRVTPPQGESHLRMLSRLSQDRTALDSATVTYRDQVSCQGPSYRCDHALTIKTS